MVALSDQECEPPAKKVYDKDTKKDNNSCIYHFDCYFLFLNNLLRCISMSTAVIKYKIPKALPLAVAKDKPLRYAIASLLILKGHYQDQGHVCKSEIKKAAVHCRRSSKQLQRYMALLIDRGYITDHSNNFYLASWDTIHRLLDIQADGFYYVRDTGRDMEKILKYFAMRQPIETQRKAFIYQLKYTPTLRERLSEVTGGKLTATAVLDTQLHCFITEGTNYTEDEREALNLVRADFMCCTHYYNDLFNLRGLGSMAYIKRTLRDQGLIQYEHRIYPLDGHTTRASRKTMLGDVLPPTRGTNSKAVLVMPDLITFFSPNTPFVPMDKI